MSWTSVRAQLANTSRRDPGNAEKITHLRTELKTARAEEYVKRLVDEAPPLSPAQLDRLITLLGTARAEAA